MSRPICIHAWLARDNGAVKDTFLYLTEPQPIHVPDEGDYWDKADDSVQLTANHGLRPGQIKRVVIVEEES